MSITLSVSKEEGHPKCNNRRKSPNTDPYRTWNNNTRRCDTNIVNKLLIPTNRFDVNALLKTEELQKIRLFFSLVWIRFCCCVQNTVTEKTLHLVRAVLRLKWCGGDQYVRRGSNRNTVGFWLLSSNLLWIDMSNRYSICHLVYRIFASLIYLQGDTVNSPYTTTEWQYNS